MKNRELPKKVFVIDDDIDLCQSLQWLLESVGLAVEVFNNSSTFLAANYSDDIEGCILLDIRMPEMSGLEIQEQLNLRQSLLPIIFITGHGDIPLAVRAMKAGAFDFITKPFNDQLLVEQIQKAIAYSHKSTIVNLQNKLVRKRLNLLTQREQQVLNLIVDGKLSKEIAYDLTISIKTVELHRSHIMKKMRAATIAEVVKFYYLATESR